MYLDSVRFGHACNSSSTHSIIWFPTINPEFTYGTNEPADRGEFGWESFVQRTRIEKLQYWVAENLKGPALSKIVPDIEVHQRDEYSSTLVTSEILGWNRANTYIDHQSVGTASFGSPEKTSKVLDAPNVVILGGNDNDDREPIVTQDKYYEMSDSLTYVDNTTGAVVFFHKPTGDKFRWVPMGTLYVKSPHPELVDLKITGYCDQGCDFCYQGSTIKGKHAPLKRIIDIIDQLVAMGTFEIAIGGGEPTQHPDFERILKYASKKNIVVNYTTKLDPKPEHLQYVGAVARSITNIWDIDNDSNAYQLGYENFKDKITYQYVIGTCRDETLQNFITKCDEIGARLTLLGYKTTGRGKKYLTNITSGQELSWIPMVLGTNNKSIAIDTLLAQQSVSELRKAGVSPKLYSLKEGAYSCYIDAVKNTIAPSSYCGYSEPLVDIISQFRAYPGEDVKVRDRVSVLFEDV